MSAWFINYSEGGANDHKQIMKQFFISNSVILIYLYLLCFTSSFFNYMCSAAVTTLISLPELPACLPVCLFVTELCIMFDFLIILSCKSLSASTLIFVTVNKFQIPLYIFFNMYLYICIYTCIYFLH